MQLAQRRKATGLVIALAALSAVAALLASRALADTAPPVTTTTQAPAVTKTVLVVGDSVAKLFANEFGDAAAKHGYAVVSAAHGGCPATGIPKVFSDGRKWETTACAAVTATQDAYVAKYHPALVIWWSRYELAPRVGSDGKVLPLGSRAYFRAQEAAFDARVRSLTRFGARLVTVQIEPPGHDLAVRNPPEKYFLVGRTWLHRPDVVNGWNAFLASHKGPTVYSVSVAHLVCHRIATPCNDTLPDGQTARPDGVHYSQTAQTLLAPRIFAEIWRASGLDTATVTGS